MKKIMHPKFLPTTVTIAGLLGFLLRLWTLGSGPDAELLYAPAPVAWTLLWIVTAAIPFFVIFTTRPLTQPLKYAQNFPASPISAIGCLLGALGLVMTGLNMFSGNPDLIQFLTAIVGTPSGIAMIMVAFARLKGNKPSFLCHASVCVFLALHTFHQCKTWSNEPQITTFLFSFLAQLSAMLAVYQLCAFDVDMGNRRTSLFWSLTAVYLSLVSLPSSENLLLSGCISLWLLTNLCSLRLPKKRKPVPQDPADSVQTPLSGSDVSIDELKSWLEEE